MDMHHLSRNSNSISRHNGYTFDMDDEDELSPKPESTSTNTGTLSLSPCPFSRFRNRSYEKKEVLKPSQEDPTVFGMGRIRRWKNIENLSVVGRDDHDDSLEEFVQAADHLPVSAPLNHLTKHRASPVPRKHKPVRKHVEDLMTE